MNSRKIGKRGIGENKYSELGRGELERVNIVSLLKGFAIRELRYGIEVEV